MVNYGYTVRYCSCYSIPGQAPKQKKIRRHKRTSFKKLFSSEVNFQEHKTEQNRWQFRELEVPNLSYFETNRSFAQLLKVDLEKDEK